MFIVLCLVEAVALYFWWPAISTNAPGCLESSTSCYSLHLQSRSHDVLLAMMTTEGYGVSNQVLASFRREPHWEELLLAWMARLHSGCVDVSSTHQPCRTRRMSSLDSVLSSVRTSLIVVSWLFMGGTLFTCTLCLWKRVGMRLMVMMSSLWWILIGRVFGVSLQLRGLQTSPIFCS